MTVMMSALIMVSCDLERIEPGTGSCVDPEGISFEYSYAGSFQDSATAILKTSDSTYLITGNTQKQGSRIMVYRTNLCRETLLHLGVGENISEHTGTGLCQVGNGDLIVAGTQDALISGRSLYIARIDKGNVITDVNNDTYDQGIGSNDIVLMNDGSFLLGGSFTTEGLFGFPKDNACMVHLSQSLDLVSVLPFSSAFSSEIFDVMQMGSGSWVGVGHVWIGFGMRILLTKSTDGGISGTSITVTYNNITGDNSVYGKAAIQSSDGNIVLTGYYNLFLNESLITFCMKVNLNGEVIWQNEYTNSAMEIIGSHVPTAIIETADGGFVITGIHKYGTSDTDVFLLKISANGAYVWDRSFGGSSSDGGEDVIQERDGGFVIVGFTKSFNESGETGRTYLLKTDSEGHIMN